ncbi:uncharacterized protein, partial [Musca autumnalis]|uniref:uncharacterized protein n=1 Tax=Musca autumnalis TaxID=221902 RepID=UPI003CFA8463
SRLFYLSIRSRAPPLLCKPELSTSDATVLKQGNGNIYLASIYLPFDSSTLPPSSELQQLVRKIKQTDHPNVHKCKLCNRFHALKACPKFLDMTPRQRNLLVLKEYYCVNCLARSHRFRDCRSHNMCRRCGRPHHTLLHTVYPEIRGSRSSPSRESNRQQTGNRSGSQNNNNNNANTGTLNPKILSEAIRAIATVLCSTSK